MAAKPRARSTRASNARRTGRKQKRGQHVLDVTVRAQQAVRQRRQRVTGLVSKLLLLVALAGGLYYGGVKAFSMLFLRNPEYNVATLDFSTDGTLSGETVFEAADLHKGENIFLVNLARARARIEAIPEVEKAEVTRKLPDRISIRINERKPVAWVAAERDNGSRQEVTSSHASYLVDTHGLLLQPRKLLPTDLYLPIIRGYDAGPRSDGQETAGDEIRAALELLRVLQDSPIAARFQVQEIDLSKHFGIVATDRNGLQALFGVEKKIDDQLQRLEIDLDTLDQRPGKPQTIDLIEERNNPVTFAPEPSPAASASPTPAASASPAKPGDHKKEHAAPSPRHGATDKRP